MPLKGKKGCEPLGQRVLPLSSLDKRKFQLRNCRSNLEVLREGLTELPSQIRRELCDVKMKTCHQHLWLWFREQNRTGKTTVIQPISVNTNPICGITMHTLLVPAWPHAHQRPEAGSSLSKHVLPPWQTSSCLQPLTGLQLLPKSNNADVKEENVRFTVVPTWAFQKLLLN